MNETATTRGLAGRAGFTLIELLIAMVIVAVLASFAINFVWKAKDRSIKASLQSDLRAAAIQQEIYFDRSAIYTNVIDSIPGYTGSPGVLLTINYAARDGWSGVTTHPAIPATICGLLVGDAPAGTAGPAVNAGVITCN